jgi:hypothetical protein
VVVTWAMVTILPPGWDGVARCVWVVSGACVDAGARVWGVVVVVVGGVVNTTVGPVEVLMIELNVVDVLPRRWSVRSVA